MKKEKKGIFFFVATICVVFHPLLIPSAFLFFGFCAGFSKTRELR